LNYTRGGTSHRAKSGIPKSLRPRHHAAVFGGHGYGHAFLNAADDHHRLIVLGSILPVPFGDGVAQRRGDLGGGFVAVISIR
jgi:hypothetical protein